MKAFFIFRDGELVGNPIGYTTEKGALKSLDKSIDRFNLRKNYKHFYSNEEVPEEYKTNGKEY